MIVKHHYLLSYLDQSDLKNLWKSKIFFIYFNGKYENVLNKYLEIWNKVKEVIRKDFDVKLMHKNITTNIQTFKNDI